MLFGRLGVCRRLFFLKLISLIGRVLILGDLKLIARCRCMNRVRVTLGLSAFDFNLCVLNLLRLALRFTRRLFLHLKRDSQVRCAPWNISDRVSILDNLQDRRQSGLESLVLLRLILLLSYLALVDNMHSIHRVLGLDAYWLTFHDL